MNSADVMDILKTNKVTSKSGILLANYLEDMKNREDGILLCNLSDSRPEYAISEYIMNHYADEVEQGIQILYELSNCQEVKRYQGYSSAVLRDPTALYSVIDTGVIRSNCAEYDYKSEFLTYGYQGRPTLVVDVETCLAIARIAAGGSVYKIIACMLKTKIKYLEVEVGTFLHNVIQELSLEEEIKAYHIGNQHGTFLMPEEILNCKVEFSYLYDTLKPIYSDNCIVNEIVELITMGANDSCQKCVMGREGTWQVVQILQDAINGNGKPLDRKELEEILPIISKGSLCPFCGQLVETLQKALLLFSKDFNEHIIKHSCSYGVCACSQNYQIDSSLCNGCMDCLEVCEYDAIDGKKGFIHIINEKMCEKCGMCLHECSEGAIKVGANLRVPNKMVKVGRFY